MASYSHSKMGTFDQCKYKYRLKYIDKVKSDIESIEAFMGKVVHETLEKLFKDLKFAKLNSRQELLAFFDMTWNERMHDKVVVAKKEYSANNYMDMGRKFLIDFYEHYKPFNHTTTIGLETQDMLTLPSGNTFHVRIDRLACDKEGNYYVCDYKTNSQLKAQEELDEDKQLAVYSLWVKRRYADAKNVKLLWYFLAFDKEMVSERNEEQLARLVNDIEQKIREIEQCKEFTTNVTALCNYCQYKPICPAWKHELELEEKGGGMKDDDGLKLVDEYAKWKQTKDEAEERLEKLRQQIIDFAQKKDTQVVWGTKNKASLRPLYKVEYPKTQEFVELLKKKGIFDELASVNYYKLAGKARANLLDAEIMELVKTEKGWQVSLSKR